MSNIDVATLKNEFSCKSSLTLKIRVSTVSDTDKGTDSATDNSNHDILGDQTSDVNKESTTPPWWMKLCFPALKTRITQTQLLFLNHSLTDNDFSVKVKKTCDEVHTNSKTLLYDAILMSIIKQICDGVKPGNIDDLTKLIVILRDCLWYIGPHYNKLLGRGCKAPELLKPFMKFNNPKFSAHGIKRLSVSTLQIYVNSISNELERSYIHSDHLKKLFSVCEKLVEALIKYIEYLESKIEKTEDGNSDLDSGQNYENRIEILPHLKDSDIRTSKLYTSQEKDLLLEIEEKVESADFFKPILINDFIPAIPHKRYKFLKKLRCNGFIHKECVLFTGCVPSKGVLYYIWIEDTAMEESVRLSARDSSASQVKKTLPKFFSRAHKRQCQKVINLLMLDKIQPAEFRAIYRLLTGDDSQSQNENSKLIDQRYMDIINTGDSSIVRDYRLHNGRKSSFDNFWDICNDVISDKTVVDERRHADVAESGEVVTHMAVAMSARDLYNQCCTKFQALGNSEESIPSFSWFKFQFWPKSAYQKTSLHYTGRLKVKFMIQQRQFHKQHPDQHYAAAIFNYCKSLAVMFKDFTSFICTDDKHKISVGEPGCPIASVERGKRVPVSLTSTFEVTDHDFSLLSPIPTVILLNDITESVDGSWYRGTPNVAIKLTATEPSSALRNAKEIASVLQEKYDDSVPPILILYTDGGPEHRSTFF